MTCSWSQSITQLINRIMLLLHENSPAEMMSLRIKTDFKMCHISKNCINFFFPIADISMTFTWHWKSFSNCQRHNSMDYLKHTLSQKGIRFLFLIMFPSPTFCQYFVLISRIVKIHYFKFLLLFTLFYLR